MTYSLIWLPHVLRQAGLKVAEEPGWETRGRREMGRVLGVVCHYTAGARTGNFPSMKVVRDGRAGLAGPLAQLGLGRDGTYYVIAAGRCNHAGEGVWRGITNGNGSFIGIEAENTGGSSDFPWPEIQMDAYHRGVAAILKHIGRGPEFCCGHAEYALPSGRKSDPNFGMDGFRTAVAAILDGRIPPRRPIPAAEPDGGRPTLRRVQPPMRGSFVKKVQAKLGVEGPDVFGPKTEAAVREFQRAHDLVPDGIVGPKTWEKLDAVRGRWKRPEPVAADDPRLRETEWPQPALAPEIVRGGNGGRRPADPASAEPEGPLPSLVWGKGRSPEFLRKVVLISREIGCEPDHLMACMAFETRETFSPSIQNPRSGATGLIQFMPRTAAALGTTTQALSRMSAEDQLDYVGRYFRWFPGIRTLEDLYMAILWPRAIGKPDDYLLFANPSVQYRQNKGLDSDRDGRVTKWEAAAAVRAKLEKGQRSASP